MNNKIIKNNIFIHIPKCGGTSVWSLKPFKFFLDQHATITQYIDEFGIEFVSKKNPFTVIRNPYDRIVSWFTFHKGKHIIYDKFESFDCWVKAEMPHHWEHVNFDVLNMISMISYNDKIFIDNNRIYKLENIGNIIPKKNVSRPNNSYRQYYTEESYNIITEKFSSQIELFNYEY